MHCSGKGKVCLEVNPLDGPPEPALEVQGSC